MALCTLHVVDNVSADPVVVEQVSHADVPLVTMLVKLGDLARKTLGLLPREVYFDAASKGWLLAAMVGRKPVGYVLFRLPRDEVVLTHLCVHPDARQGGIAKLLIDEVSRRYQDRQGVKAKR